VVVWAANQPAPHLPSTSGAWAWLVVAIGVYLVGACVLRGERWLLLLRRNGAEDVHRSDCYALNAVGFMGNNVLPARAGDAMRVVAMAPRAHVTYRTVIGTLVAERVLDVVVLLGIFVIVAFGLLHGIALPSGQRFALLVAVALLLLIVGLGVGIWLARRGTLRKWLDFLAPMARATANLRGRHGAEALTLTVVIWATEIAVWWATGRAAGLDFDFLQACYLVSLASIFVLVPAGPGYLGTLDAAVIFGVKAIGGSGADALSYLLLLRFVLLVPITLVGLGALMARYRGVRFMRTEVQGA
jgi:glycosyltransferase 2 family protein